MLHVAAFRPNKKRVVRKHTYHHHREGINSYALNKTRLRMGKSIHSRTSLMTERALILG